MLNHHAQLASSLAGQLGLPEPVLEAIGAAYEQWDGKGWPGTLKGEQVPVAARISQVAEFAEVAYRVGGPREVSMLTEHRWLGQFDPRLAEALVADADLILADLDQLQSWDAVIGAEPSLAVFLTGDRFDAALEAVANFVDLKSHTSWGIRGRSRRWQLPLRRRSICRLAASSLSAGRRWCAGSGGWGMAAPCCIRCVMCASTSAITSLGLKMRNSVPASAPEVWPGST
jgi:HD domain-containing protein